MASPRPLRRIASGPASRPRPRDRYEDAASIYGIPYWGKGFFHVSEEGELVVRPTREAARGVALKQIVEQHFDVLITDLHMPGAGDGFAVVTAMRHAQPEALTLVVSGFPDVQEAMAAILLQADEVLVKPFDFDRLEQLIRDVADRPPAHPAL